MAISYRHSAALAVQACTDRPGRGLRRILRSTCDALSSDRVELLARAVMLVAGMATPEEERAALLARVVACVAGRSVGIHADVVGSVPAAQHPADTLVDVVDVRDERHH